nr:MAG: RNA-dependent RNA polymerase [Hemiptera chuvirus 2]
MRLRRLDTEVLKLCERPNAFSFDILLFTMFESQRKILFNAPLSVIHSRKLDSALRTSTANEFKKRTYLYGNPKYDDKFFVAAVAALDSKIRLNQVASNKQIWCRLLNDSLSGNHSYKDGSFRKLPSLIAANLKLQTGFNLQSVTAESLKPTSASVNQYINKVLNPPSELVNLTSLASLLEGAVEALGKDHDASLKTAEERLTKLPKLCTWENTTIHLSMAWSNQLLFIRYKEQLTIVPRDYLLLMHNKCSDLVSILWFSHLSSGAGLETSAYQKTVEFVCEMCDMVKTYGQDAYKAFKVIESLGVGISLVEIDGATNAAFMNDICKALLVDQDISIRDSPLLSLLRSSSPPLRHELMCLTKVLGHPFVSMKAGTEQLHERTTRPAALDERLILDSVRHAKRNYIKSYILKEGKWPPCRLLCESRLSRPWADGRDPDSQRYTKTSGPVNLADYDVVDITKCLKFNRFENIIPYLKDKTISVLKTKVLGKYITEVCQDRLPWTETRLLLYFLFNTMAETDHLNYLDEWVNNDENFDWETVVDYLIIRIVPKEKEMKESYRGFGCKTLFDRMRCLIQEMNTANYLDLYSNEQAMTLDELGILHKLLNFRRIHKAYKAYTPLYLVIDASGWNNMFRHETVAPVTEATLDKIFDTGIFSKTMLAYEHTMFYVPDHEGTWYWQGQLGGIEGLNQYTWDVVYLAQIRAALEGFGLDPILFAKGDDLRAVLLIPPKMLETRSVNDIRLEIVRLIKDKMASLGHVINVTESYGSTKYFAFSKAASIGMIEMPQTYRKIEKCYGANNAFLPFLDDYIASSFSNAHSSCKETSSVVACYAVALFWTYFHLCKHPQYKKRSNAELIALSLVPSMLGGFPIIYLHNMWVRAESDLLSPFLSLCHYVKKVDMDVYEHLIKFLTVRVIPVEKAFVGLLVDPYSLPIQKPVTATTVLRKMIVPALRRKIKNELVLELLDSAESEEMELIIQSLMSANVYSAKLLAALYAASPQGLINELTRKFESARSVIEVLILRWGRRRAAAQIRRILFADDKIHRYRNQVLDDQLQDATDFQYILTSYDGCPGKQAHELRRIMWTKPVEGISMPPVQHQLTLMLLSDGIDNEWCAQNHFSYFLKRPDQSVTNISLPIYTSGQEKPFIGFKTRMGMTAPREKLIDSDEVLNKVKNLIDLLSWVRVHALTTGTGEANLEKVVYILLSLYITIDPYRLTPFRGARKSGTIQHHVRAPHFRESIVPNTLSNLYTRFHGTSNTHITLRSSGAHYKVNFLHLYCHSVFLATMRFQFSNVEIPYDIAFWGVTTSCKHCNEPITESPISVDVSKLKRVKFTTLKTTKLSLHAKQIITESLSQVGPRLQRDISDVGDLPAEVAQAAIMQEFLAQHHLIRNRVNDYDYRHAMSSEAYEILSGLKGIPQSRQVSDTEMKRIPVKTIFNCLMIETLEAIYSLYPDNDITNIASWLYSQPGAEFPWTPLVEKIYYIGRLTHLIHYAHKTSNILPSDAYDSPKAASLYLALAAYVTFHTDPPPPLPVTYLNHYPLEDFSAFYLPHAKMVKHRWAKAKLYPLISQLMKTQTDVSSTKRVLHRAIIIYWSCPMLDKEALQNELINIPLNTHLELDVLPLHGTMVESLDVDYHQLPGCCHKVVNLSAWECTFEQEVTAMLARQEITDEATKILTDLAPDLKLSVTYSTLPDCIGRVRRCPVIKPTLSSGARIQLRDNNLPLTSMVDRASSTSFYIRPYRGHSSTLTLDDTLVDAPILLPGRHVKPWKIHRTIGFGTSSPSKLMYILLELKLTFLPHHSAYACLADGHGGFAATIDALTNHSVIVFNTLIAQYEAETLPSSWDASQSTNEVTYLSVQKGCSDLTKMTTINSLITECPAKMEMVTCDAQTVGMDLVSRELLLRHVVVYYLKTRSNTGMLILKLYYNEMELNFRILHELSKYCFQLQFCKPPASGHNVEVYLICQGSLQAYPHDGSGMLQGYPPKSVIYALIKWLSSLSKRYEWINETSVQIDLQIPKCDPAWFITPPLALRTLSSFCGITYTQVEWTKTSRGKNFRSCISDIESRALTAITVMLSELAKGNDPDHEAKVSWDTTTLAHGRILCSRLMCAGGCFLTLGRCLSNTIITETNLRHLFAKLYQRMRAKTSVLPADWKMFYERVNPLPGDWQLYQDFLNGSEVALALVGYILQLGGFDQDVEIMEESDASGASDDAMEVDC